MDKIGLIQGEEITHNLFLSHHDELHDESLRSAHAN